MSKGLSTVSSYWSTEVTFTSNSFCIMDTKIINYALSSADVENQQGEKELGEVAMGTAYGMFPFALPRGFRL